MNFDFSWLWLDITCIKVHIEKNHPHCRSISILLLIIYIWCWSAICLTNLPCPNSQTLGLYGNSKLLQIYILYMNITELSVLVERYWLLRLVFVSIMSYTWVLQRKWCNFTRNLTNDIQTDDYSQGQITLWYAKME